MQLFIDKEPMDMKSKLIIQICNKSPIESMGKSIHVIVIFHYLFQLVKLKNHFYMHPHKISVYKRMETLILRSTRKMASKKNETLKVVFSV